MFKIFETLSAAVAASNAVQLRRRPSDRVLRQLGIDPKTFPDMTKL